MGGGLMQLVAYGAQDLYLTGEPEITFFKNIYKRHTNYSVEAIEQTFNGQVGFGKRVSCTISRNGDLITNMYLEVVMEADGATWFPVEALVKEVELEIGGQKIDRHYSDWFRIYDELFRTGTQKNAYFRMTNFPNEDRVIGTPIKRRLYLPLIFFFNKEPGMALPLIALQFHEVKVHFTFSNASEIEGIKTVGSDLDATLYVDYVYLDTEERKRFASSNHEMLIEQLQFTGNESITLGQNKVQKNIRLNFNHPVKYLAWVVKGNKHGIYNNSHPFPWNEDLNVDSFEVSEDSLDEEATKAILTSSPHNWAPSDFDDVIADLKSGSVPALFADVEKKRAFYLNRQFTFTGEGSFIDDTYAPLYSAKLQLNGHDRFSERKGSFFNQVQAYQCCQSLPAAGVYMYSFALEPRKHQPTGTCNFSRIDNATLQLTFKSVNSSVRNAKNVDSDNNTVLNRYDLRDIKVYAVNYNVLRIMSGMGGLAFSN
jgi:Large eukaryotic DNA virus major capsid protein/Major capsid protein N-terminus